MRVEIGKKRKLIQVGAKNRGELSCSCIVIAMQTCNAAHHALCIGTSPDLPHLVHSPIEGYTLCNMHPHVLVGGGGGGHIMPVGGYMCLTLHRR